MKNKTAKAVANALSAIKSDIESLQKNDERQDKVIDAQSQELARLQSEITDIRNSLIAQKAINRVPYAQISAEHGGISKSRISQIKKQYTQ